MSIKRLSGAGLTTPKSNKLWDQTTFQSGMFALATVSLTSTSTTVVFDNIPSNYTNLQIRALVRTNRVDVADGMTLRFNTDVGSNYAYYILRGDGSGGGTYTSGGLTTSILLTYDFASANATANVFGAGIIDIQDYSSTTKAKTVRSFTGRDNNGDGATALDSGLWQSTSAITKITLAPNAGTSFVANSHFALYGIKGA
jgi:hypothetical protein